MPTYDQSEKIALGALMTRFTRLWRQRYLDQKTKEELDARLASYPEQFERLKAAFAIFGVTGFKSENWEQLRQDIGAGIYKAALARVGIPDPLAVTKPEEATVVAAAIEDLLDDTQKANSATDAGGTVREIVIEQLKLAGDKGAKAGDIREYIEKLRGTTLHEKTVGMTLYRLSHDGLVRRVGRTWFFVPEAKNPGAEDAGAINRDDKEGEEP